MKTNAYKPPSSREQNKNMFKSTDDALQFKLVDEQFPDLSPINNKTVVVIEKNDLNFKDASIKEIDVVAETVEKTKVEVILEGWVQLRQDTSSRETLLKQYNTNGVIEERLLFEEEFDEEEYNTRQMKLLEMLYSSRQMRIDDYHAIHGDGEYDNLYPLLNEEDEVDDEYYDDYYE